MLIDSIELENFGPYRGKTTIRLGHAPHPIVVIHGDNMAGKTTIFNALRWALYGEALDRSGVRMRDVDLLNHRSRDAQDCQFGVKLVVRVEEGNSQAEYVIHRRAVAERPSPDGLRETDFVEKLQVSKDDHWVNADQAQAAIADILPPGIARFFLFDGEMLSEYEALVREGGDDAAMQVRQAIESILGLPALTMGRDDLAAVRDVTQRRLRAELKKRDAASDAEKELSALEAKRLSLEIDRDGARSKIARADSRLSELNAELSAVEGFEADAATLMGIEKSRKAIEDEGNRLREERKRHAVDLWRDVLAASLKGQIGDLEMEREALEEQLREGMTLAASSEHLRQSLVALECATCGQPLPDSLVAAWRAELARVEDRLSELDLDAVAARKDEISNVVRELRDLAPAGVHAAIEGIEKALELQAVEDYRLKLEKERVEARMGDRDPKKISEFQAERDRNIDARARAREHLTVATESLQRNADEVKKIFSKLEQRNDPQVVALQLELAIIEEMEGVVEATITRFVEELRNEVQAAASTIFLGLTTDKSYVALRINDRYGLTILDQLNQPVNVRSAGAEQVVALSLIGALNRLAVKRGPVIMDTPFGRLDKKHRANILDFMPRLGEQAVLLVHDGEVDPERDLTDLRPLIAREYEISRTPEGDSTLKEVSLHA